MAYYTSHFKVLRKQWYLILVVTIIFVVLTTFKLDTAYQVSRESNLASSIKLVKFAFIIEPQILLEQLNDSSVNLLSERFNVSKSYPQCSHCITLGVFADEFWKLTTIVRKLYGNKVNIVSQVIQEHPFLENPVLCHLFLRLDYYFIHLVLFHRIQQFLWIGDIPAKEQAYLPLDFVLYYGEHQEIYDIFHKLEDQIYLDDIFHFLSQRHTSRYLHCPPTREKWLVENNLTVDFKKQLKFEESFVTMKSLMKWLKLPFWMSSGTMLGWYRQCHITPYTTDTDFGTWPGHFTTQTSNILKKEAPKYGLKLVHRFGHPNNSLEYRFHTLRDSAQVDLFVIYSNGSHFMLPIHYPPKGFIYQLYPRYKICSGALLGHKLNVPCPPETVIIAEYGDTWQKPIPSWRYTDNISPMLPFPSEFGSQQDYFY